ncbi:hypothetical protein TNCT_430411 [Trichonephila clavata]|uniref:Uncharacterized protein n=1 Tax=Trichonephila clavata TaxID=2740835 RepID=A0A8X6H9S3_TRICU|nr:hypothetical protein TNCT_430411 [Trichonephila clavata]
MEYTHIEVDSLVPLKDEADSRQQDDRKPTDAVRTSSAEYTHLKEDSHGKQILNSTGVRCHFSFLRPIIANSPQAFSK